MEAAFRLGACAESITHGYADDPAVTFVSLTKERAENIRKTLKEVVDLLGKETK
jgi:hypothetical protein